MKPECSASPIIKAKNLDQQENNINGRKTLHVLQQEAGDKENLVGAGRMLQQTDKFKDIKDTYEKNNLINESINDQHLAKINGKKKVSHMSLQLDKEVVIKDVVITVDDLTTTGEPSENYWKILAERRRVALIETLTENRLLHEKNEILEQENKLCREMLEDSKCLVEVLTEMVGDVSSSDMTDQDDSLGNVSL